MLTQEQAHSLFEYKDGMLYWKIRPKNSRIPNGNMEAGSQSGHGYKKVTTNGKAFYTHQIIFLMQHGKIIETTTSDKLAENPENYPAIKNFTQGLTSDTTNN